jgi:PBP1b-binding outer membrane lipoprotein LpoB
MPTSGSLTLVKNRLVLIMMNMYKLFLVVLIGSILINGCSESPLVRYPKFLEKKQEFKSVSLLADILILDAMSSDTILVNLPENKKLGRVCLDFFASTMQEKGYLLDNSLLTSVGLLAENDRNYKLISSEFEENLSDNEIPQSYPPFYIHDTFNKDTIYKQLLQTVYRRIVGYEKSEEDSSRYLRTSTYLGKLFGTDCFAFLFVGGYNVRATQQSELFKNPKVDSYDKVAYGRISQMTMLFYIVDSRTGEIIWDDHINMKGGLIYKEKLIKIARKILEQLP